MLDIEQILKDNDIPYSTTGENTAPGYVNVECPFCDDMTNHGGFNVKQKYYNCWRCGWHPLDEALAELTGWTYNEVVNIIHEYTTDFVRDSINKNAKNNTNTDLKLPYGVTEMTDIHHKYLQDRNFDPEKLEREFKLLGTHHIGNYKFRIMAPIFFNNKLVSYQARDITNKQKLRYKACRKENEVIHHKNILYNIDNAKSDKIVVVEGITDVWRLGAGSVATFGVKYTTSQIKYLTNYKKIIILFDTEENAQHCAMSIAKMLKILNKNVHIIELPEGDPALLNQDDADYFMRSV